MQKSGVIPIILDVKSGKAEWITQVNCDIKDSKHIIVRNVAFECKGSTTLYILKCDTLGCVPFAIVKDGDNICPGTKIEHRGQLSNQWKFFLDKVEPRENLGHCVVDNITCKVAMILEYN